MDQDFIVADSPRLECPVLYLRETGTLTSGLIAHAIKKVLRMCRMQQVSDELETYEGGRFLRLKPIGEWEGKNE